MRAVILVLLISLSVFISGCGNQNETQPPIKSKDDTAAPKQPNSTAANPSSTINQPQEIFYGQWLIKRLLAYGPVGTYSNEDIKNIVGRKLSFSKEKASCFGDQIKYLDDVAVNPVYTKTGISKSDFAREYRNRLTFDDLEIRSDSITQINVSDSKGNRCIFFVRDNDTLILQGGGVFLELARER